MPTRPPDPLCIAARLLADVQDAALDDAAFRQRAQRTVKRLHRALAPPAAPASSPRKRASKISRYRFIAVPNGAGGTTSVSIAVAAFDELACALGGAAQVNELARKAASSHDPDSGMSRSAHVLRRLQRRAARSQPQPGTRSRQ